MKIFQFGASRFYIEIFREESATSKYGKSSAILKEKNTMLKIEVVTYTNESLEDLLIKLREKVSIKFQYANKFETEAALELIDNAIEKVKYPPSSKVS